jgi:hypothetical protein
MNNETQHGYLVLAAISGYTSYLVGVKLTHARDILAELLNLIVEHFKPFLSLYRSRAGRRVRWRGSCSNRRRLNSNSTNMRD